MEGEFTFPTVAVPAEAEDQRDVGELPFPAGHLPAAATTSALWPFSSSSSPETTPRVRATAEEEAPPPRRGGRVVVQQRSEAAADEDLMDLLWEDFNDDVERHAGSGDGGGYRCPRSSTPSSSDAESEEASTSGRRHGCAPTMLRASSRAGGAGQFYASSSRRRRGRKMTGWALLMRLFRRLFAVDKTPPPSQSRRHGIYAAP